MYYIYLLKRPKPKCGAGFTLIELIIYIGVVSLFLIGVVNLAYVVRNTRARFIVASVTNQTAARVLNTVDALVRNADGFVTDSAGTKCVFSDKLWLYYATTSAQYLPSGCLGSYSSGAVGIEPYSFSGATTTSADSPWNAKEGYGSFIDSKYLYSVGSLNNGWHISKRYLADMKYDTGFDSDGAISSSGNYGARAVTSDGQYLYVVGGNEADATTNSARIEKRRTSNGSLDTSFDTDGIMTPSSAKIYKAIAIDGSSMYLAGYTYASGGTQTSVGPSSGGTFVNDSTVGTLNWDLPSNAQTSNDGRAAVNFNATNDTSRYLKATNFGFSIPSTATIDGIVVEVERRNTYFVEGTVVDNSVKIVKTGTISGTDKASGTAWPASDAYATYGSASDLWGLTWSPSDINSSSFGVAMSAKGTSVPDTQTPAIDHIRITVYYTPQTVNDWIIEKRSMSTGALDTGFDGDGIINSSTTGKTNGTANDLVLDIPNNHVYIVGDAGGSRTIEKRLATTGAYVAAFDTDGYAQSSGGTYNSIAFDGASLYAAGGDGSDLVIQKYTASNGALDASFGTSGTATAVSATTAAYGIALDGENVFIVGHSSNDWYIEERDKTTGTLVTGFGTGGSITGNATTDSPYGGVQLDENYLYVVGTTVIASVRYQYIEKRHTAGGSFDERNGLRLMCYQDYPNQGKGSTCSADPPHSDISRQDLTDPSRVFVGLTDFIVATTTAGSRQAFEVKLNIRHLGSATDIGIATTTASTTAAFRIDA